MTEGHNHVRAIFERWRRLEEEKKVVSEDLKELFAEAKSHGFNTKAMRESFRRAVKDESRTDADAEHDALVEMYMAAIQGRAHPAPARVETIGEIQPAANSDGAQGGASFNAGDEVQAAGPVRDPGHIYCQSPEVPQVSTQDRAEPVSVAPAAAQPISRDEPEIPVHLRRAK
jgi:uncharacterized protein (UPF0335 family)